MTPVAYDVHAMEWIERVHGRWVHLSQDPEANAAWQRVGRKDTFGGVMVRYIGDRPTVFTDTLTSDNEGPYVAAMHEVGHVATGQFERGGVMGTVLGDDHAYAQIVVMTEVWAWNWAQKNILVPMSERMVKESTQALMTYVYHWPENGWLKTLHEPMRSQLNPMYL